MDFETLLACVAILPVVSVLGTDVNACGSRQNIVTIEACSDRTLYGKYAAITSPSSFYANAYVTCVCDVTVYGESDVFVEYTSPGYNRCGIQFTYTNLVYSCSNAHVQYEYKSNTVVFKKTTTGNPPSCFLFSTDVLVAAASSKITCHRPTSIDWLSTQGLAAQSSIIATASTSVVPTSINTSTASTTRETPATTSVSTISSQTSSVAPTLLTTSTKTTPTATERTTIKTTSTLPSSSASTSNSNQSSSSSTTSLSQSPPTSTLTLPDNTAAPSASTPTTNTPPPSPSTPTTNTPPSSPYTPTTNTPPSSPYTPTTNTPPSSPYTPTTNTPPSSSSVSLSNISPSVTKHMPTSSTALTHTSTSSSSVNTSITASTSENASSSTASPTTEPNPASTTFRTTSNTGPPPDTTPTAATEMPPHSPTSSPFTTVSIAMTSIGVSSTDAGVTTGSTKETSTMTTAVDTVDSTTTVTPFTSRTDTISEVSTLQQTSMNSMADISTVATTLSEVTDTSTVATTLSEVESMTSAVTSDVVSSTAPSAAVLLNDEGTADRSYGTVVLVSCSVGGVLVVALVLVFLFVWVLRKQSRGGDNSTTSSQTSYIDAYDSEEVMQHQYALFPSVTRHDDVTHDVPHIQVPGSGDIYAIVTRHGPRIAHVQQTTLSSFKCQPASESLKGQEIVYQTPGQIPTEEPGASESLRGLANQELTERKTQVAPESYQGFESGYQLPGIAAESGHQIPGIEALQTNVEWLKGQTNENKAMRHSVSETASLETSNTETLPRKGILKKTDSGRSISSCGVRISDHVMYNTGGHDSMTGVRISDHVMYNTGGQDSMTNSDRGSFRNTTGGQDSMTNSDRGSFLVEDERARVYRERWENAPDIGSFQEHLI